jgi:CRISPR-associated protein Cmr1
LSNNKIEKFTLEVVTPVFISGADQQENEFRVTAIKGLLRWWWRAANGHRTLDELKKAESDIFGSTERRSAFAITMQGAQNIATSDDGLPSGKKVMAQSRGRKFPISIIDYLAFGIAEYNKEKKGNVYNRPHIKPGTKFDLFIRFYKDSYKDDIVKALNFMCRYGGVGAKSRNGFGGLTSAHLPAAKQSIASDLASFHAFSRESRLFVFNEHSKWVDALQEIGEHYRAARLSLEPRHSFDKRRYIATPLKADNNRTNINDRNAKGFFLSVQKRNDTFRGQILHLPYAYHNASERKKYADANQAVCDYLKSRCKGVRNEF